MKALWTAVEAWSIGRRSFFVRDVGYANRARFVAFGKLKEHRKAGLRKLAEEVVEAMRRARTV